MRTFFLLLSLVAGVTFPLFPVGAEERFAANDVDFLNLMGNREGYRGYGTVTDYAPISPGRDLRQMTIGEVLDYQQELLDKGSSSTAVGRYQFIRDTLAAVVERHGISRDILFDEEIQTFLARLLMRDCGFYETDRDEVGLGNCLAQQWAALPMLSGDHFGRSFYEGDGLNHHAVSTDLFLAVLKDRFFW